MVSFFALLPEWFEFGVFCCYFLTLIFRNRLVSNRKPSSERVSAKRKKNLEQKIVREEENENRENFGKPIVKFPCECFIADNQQILISKMKRNTYLVNVSMCIWHLFGYFMDEDSDCYSISAASNANKISSKSQLDGEYRKKEGQRKELRSLCLCLSPSLSYHQLSI